MTDTEKIEAASNKYRDDDFANNPNGYDVSPWANNETTSTAFAAGIAWRDANPSEKVQALVEALKACDDQMTYYHCEIQVPTSWQDVHTQVKEALQKWRGE